MDFESPDAGRLARIVAQEGEPVAVKELIALLADNDADADAYLAGQGKSAAINGHDYLPHAYSTLHPANGSQSLERSPIAAVTAEGRVKASPAARRARGRARD